MRQWQREEENFRSVRVGKRTMAELKSMLEVLGLERSGRQVIGVDAIGFAMFAEILERNKFSF